jgi:hypothetical protein
MRARASLDSDSVEEDETGLSADRPEAIDAAPDPVGIGVADRDPTDAAGRPWLLKAASVFTIGNFLTFLPGPYAEDLFGGVLRRREIPLLLAAIAGAIFGLSLLTHKPRFVPARLAAFALSLAVGTAAGRFSLSPPDLSKFVLSLGINSYLSAIAIFVLAILAGVVLDRARPNRRTLVFLAALVIPFLVLGIITCVLSPAGPASTYRERAAGGSKPVSEPGPSGRHADAPPRPHGTVSEDRLPASRKATLDQWAQPNDSTRSLGAGDE